MAESGLSFSDAEMATITFQSEKPVQTMHQALEELAEATEDQTLQEQIKECIAYDRHCLELFETNDGSFFYQIRLRDDKDDDIMGHFASVKLALEYMEDKKVPFSIEKYQIIGLREHVITHKGYWNPHFFPENPVEEYPYDGHSVGSCSYDAEGTLLYHWTEEIGEQERNKVDDWGAFRFEHRYIAFPNPFERGDLVRCTNRADVIGVVETSQADWIEWEKQAREQNLKLDYYDASITVEFPMDRGTFSHDHIPPIYLEKIELGDLEGDERKEILEAASHMLIGKTSLDWFTTVCENYKEKMSEKA